MLCYLIKCPEKTGLIKRWQRWAQGDGWGGIPIVNFELTPIIF